ncbi:MAG: hypothetical protein K2P93_00870 [Alphaproteobacteria bacterium]|nr:hypothetical protein [Alphaproteobacteria bacterium]
MNLTFNKMSTSSNKKKNSLFNKKNFFIGSGIFCLIALITTFYLLLTDDYTDAKFRTMQDELPSSEKFDITGLRELQASGGPIVDFSDLKKKLSHVQKNIIIADGLWEFHGYIYNIPATYFGYQRATPDLRYPLRRLLFTGTTEARRELVIPESEVAQQYGFHYINIKIDSKVRTPDKAVDEFVHFIDNLPENTWIHFHCRHGKGRTSMMLIMLDIMKNAPQVALDDIVKRQRLLGSEDLFDTRDWKKGTYTSETLERRKEFIKQFYEFICQRKAGGFQRWSEWRYFVTQKSTLPNASPLAPR